MKCIMALLLAGAALIVQPVIGRSVFNHVPEKDRPRRNPLAKDADATRAGQKLFEQNCAQCHGAAAEGGRRAPPLTGGDVEFATPGEIFWVITNGVVRHGMPSWSKLPEPQRWQIVTYLRSLNQPQPDVSRRGPIQP